MYHQSKPPDKLRLLTILLAVLSITSLTIQAQSTVTNGLVAYWNFDQKNFKDSVGKYDGTENGNAPIQFVASKNGFGQAIHLEGPADSGGQDQYVEITGGADPDELAFPGGSMSISAWFTVDSFDKSWQALIAKGEGTNWRVHRNNANSFMAFSGGEGEGTAEGPDVTDGAWHHIVAVVDANAVNFGNAIYVDGGQYSVNTGTPNLNTNGKNVMIGENPDARNRYWHGNIDDIGIWNRALTEAEIAALYAGGTGKAIGAFSNPLVDSDKDGMPDDWEIKYGLNPNDPSDAAKDCNNNGITNLDEYKLGLDPCDVTKPTVVSTSGTQTFDAIKLTFSKPLDFATATNVANYSITPSLTISNATYKGSVVTLSTAKQAPASTYTVSIKGVKDVSRNEIAAGSTATVYSFVMTKTGLLKWSYWGDALGGDQVPGAAVQALLDDPRYPNSPVMVLPVYSFTSRDAFPDDSHEFYGATIEGYLTPKETAKYYFFTSSDDASQLWLSTDDKEANLVLIAEETGCCQGFLEPDPNVTGWHDNGSGMGQTTLTPISLVAGKSYFIRMIYKENTGGDFGLVAWRKQGDTTAANKLKPIPGEFLSSAVDLPGPPAVSQNIIASVARAGNNLTIQWSPAGGTLETSPALGATAAWTAVGTANPATITIGKSTAFYRVHK